MKKVFIGVSMLMGFTMSLILSLLGTMLGGHFTIPSWLISFGISLLISIVLGLFIPIKKLGDGLCRVCHADPRSFKGNLLCSLVSDLIYTPLITIVMVNVMIRSAAAHAPAGAVIPSVGRVLSSSLPICFIAGYVSIMLFQPLFVGLCISIAQRKGLPDMKQPAEDPGRRQK